jgi:hypothetical protein
MKNQTTEPRPQTGSAEHDACERREAAVPFDRESELRRLLELTKERRKLLVAGVDYRKSWGVRR